MVIFLYVCTLSINDKIIMIKGAPKGGLAIRVLILGRGVNLLTLPPSLVTFYIFP